MDTELSSLFLMAIFCYNSYLEFMYPNKHCGSEAGQIFYISSLYLPNWLCNYTHSHISMAINFSSAILKDLISKVTAREFLGINFGVKKFPESEVIIADFVVFNIIQVRKNF